MDSVGESGRSTHPPRSAPSLPAREFRPAHGAVIRAPRPAFAVGMADSAAWARVDDLEELEETRRGRRLERRAAGDAIAAGATLPLDQGIARVAELGGPDDAPRARQGPDQGEPGGDRRRGPRGE